MRSSLTQITWSRRAAPMGPSTEHSNACALAVIVDGIRVRGIVTIWACAVLLATPGLVIAEDKGSNETANKVEETIEVKRKETKDPKHPSLRFLKDHRVFLRAQLDLLRLQITRVRSDHAELLDERLLRLKEMSAAIAAARDTVRAEHQLTAERELLDSITELGDLEAQLALMERVLTVQRQRLLFLEQDFLGHQETALVILIKGLSGKHAPASVVVVEENDVVRITLSPAQQVSLEQGGIAQIYHEFVEPREHVFLVSFTGNAWADRAPVAVAVETARDRLTFLELDVSQLDPGREASGLLTSVWYR